MKLKPHPPLRAQCRVDTPLGPLTLAATENGLAAALFDAQAHHPGQLTAPIDPSQPHLARAAAEFAAYFAARFAARFAASLAAGFAPPALGAFNGFTVPLDAQGTPFQQQVWQALLRIPQGHLSTYGEIARQLGLPAAARAVGAAVGRNPIAIAVPCHRVMGRDGTLTGYAAGLPRKQALLQHEGARLL